jgi:hypothetical protein
MMYGELNIREGRVIYVHGSVDPWHALGITHTKVKDNVAIFIQGKFLYCINSRVFKKFYRSTSTS